MQELTANGLKRHKHIVAISTCIAASVFVGCGGPHNASVEGYVTLDGNALPTGNITFRPVAQGTTAYGSIDDTGHYVLQTGREYGLASGEYQVAIVARERPTAQYGENGGPPPAGKQITPNWYRSPEHSGLKFTVEPGSNEIDLPLTTDPPPGWQQQRRRRR